MKITSITKKNKNYEIKLEKGDPFLILDETILNYNLYKNKDISKSDIKEILNYNNLMEYYNKCVNKINYKRRTKNEIISFLNKENISINDSNTVIAKLEKANLINDLDYINAFINDEINLTLNGPYKIKQRLYKKGFNKSDINAFLDNISNDIWVSRINKIIIKKDKSIKNKSSKEKRNKIINDLLKEGFNKSDILKVINNYEFKNDLKTLLKEYNKLLRKYEKKDIDDDKKDYLIQSELKLKGYTPDEINKVVN